MCDENLLHKMLIVWSRNAVVAAKRHPGKLPVSNIEDTDALTRGLPKSAPSVHEL
jgi:hypothetical protein